MKDHKKTVKVIHWFFLGMLMFVPGLLKLFVSGYSGVAGMLTNLGFPEVFFFTWLLIIGEIGSGILIFSRWKLNYIIYIPMIILTVAAFTVHWGSWSNFILHLVAVSGYWILGQEKLD
ncbi:hypothetical protein COU58_02670 [Candidatus Pacearchaeota archaeon CG10_big_fil_rev_8_21_14_0_10_32_42]|nr:MAG: hypothetical protein COU58_02670 [Candidatus Pacearchaeota archaeon CG10_big_fil_rev_8_21_14_0_10_32_42]